MTKISSTAGSRAGFGVVSAAVLTIGLLPALAAQKKAPERFTGGVTKEERIAQMQAIYAEVSARLPQGHDSAPIFVDISQQDRDAVNNPVTTERAPQRIGVVKGINQTVGKPAGIAGFQPGVLDEGEDGFVWAVTITSPGAQAIRLHIENCSLPDNAQLFLLGENGQADGPYVDRGRNGTGDFWTRSIVGETGTIVVQYSGARPSANKTRTSLLITELAHISGRPPKPLLQNHDSWTCSDNASCLIDAMCVNNQAVNDAKAAIAKLEWIRGPFIYTCTGGLIADTDTSSVIPLMLSANHCFSRNISNLETFFNYTTSSCNGSCPDSLVTGGTPPPADTVGITVNATNQNSDYTLFTLNGNPPTGTLFLGWNRSPVAHSNNSNLYRISNPNFGPQVYSVHSVDDTGPECVGTAHGAWIYSKDTMGATQGGSSGSPVVNANGEIVGQLTGCCGYNCSNVCDADNNWTIDGALANYFSEVESILDPQGGGGGGCSASADCDDGLYCNGTEFCDASGACQPGSAPTCGPGEACDESIDSCVVLTCGVNKASCVTNADCCSNNCKGNVCRGN